jgi:septal ring factor EnvC (AmiA/AmiB activator)
MDQERTMQFILDNLAAVTASQQQFAVQTAARAARTDRQIKGMQTLMLTGMKMIVKLQKGQRELQKEMKELAAAQKRAGEALADLAVSQKRSDQKFDRWLDSLKGGSNGHTRHEKR